MVIFQLILKVLQLFFLDWGSFNDYLDTILPFFDHHILLIYFLNPECGQKWHFWTTSSCPWSHWTSDISKIKKGFIMQIVCIITSILHYFFFSLECNFLWRFKRLVVNKVIEIYIAFAPKLGTLSQYWTDFTVQLVCTNK